ncbi:MAG: 4-(cytidine 5'-diphospho)-2-C-methyl-D-erythritol kinase [Acidimicrobiia bacterium]|nr:4-(cytidine 5'-diphospho)-2-C-methyl-D-erythritol kinase [Acidimicrobiia bacterium]
MRARARAKINLTLLVRPRDRTGLHPLRSLVRSVDWEDVLDLVVDDEDRLVVVGDAAEGVPDDEANLAWRAVEEVRRVAGRQRPLTMRLDKRIPHAAGLGGGSADAAAALRLAATVLGHRGDIAASSLGADVPFCLRGGSAWMEGYGERITAVPLPADYALAVVVPEMELPTPAVYGRWDQLGGPEGEEVGRRDLPGSLRDVGPVRNDLTPAAIHLRPELGDRIADLRRRWGQPVAMTGSGSALFGFFGTRAEAAEAVAEAGPSRAARAVEPVDEGVVLVGDPPDGP